MCDIITRILCRLFIRFKLESIQMVLRMKLILSALTALTSICPDFKFFTFLPLNILYIYIQ